MAKLVILEGADGVGKSHLGEQIAKAIEFDFYHPKFELDKYPHVIGKYDDLVLSRLDFIDMRIVQHRSFLSVIAFNPEMSKYFGVWQANLAKWDKVLVILLDFSGLNMLKKVTGATSFGQNDEALTYQQQIIRKWFNRITKLKKLHVIRKDESTDMNLILSRCREVGL